jgi:Glucodextranase, domain B
LADVPGLRGGGTPAMSDPSKPGPDSSRSLAAPLPKVAVAASSRRSVALTAVGASVVLVGALVVLALRASRSVGEKPRVIPPAAPQVGSRFHPAGPEVESRIFEVTEATGRVEAQRDGKWVLVATGDALTQDDLVRTGNGRAILKLAGTTEIELRDRVEIRLDSISRAGASVDLRRGRVVAHVGRTGGNVAITAARTRTANESGAPARFVVTADEHGRVSVATTEGAARFESAGRVVKVSAGNVTRAEPDQPPVDPERISEDVFLSVAWPSADRRGEKAPVAGRAAPGSVVRVNGTETDVDRGGHFATSVPLRVGQNPIEVEVEDIAGRSRREKRQIRKIPTGAPELAPVPTELWKK